MKRIVYLFVALLMMATADAQTLTERQKGLAACACLMAQGDMNRLEPTVRMALNKGVTIYYSAEHGLFHIFCVLWAVWFNYSVTDFDYLYS